MNFVVVHPSSRFTYKTYPSNMLAWAIIIPVYIYISIKYYNSTGKQKKLATEFTGIPVIMDTVYVPYLRLWSRFSFFQILNTGNWCQTVN